MTRKSIFFFSAVLILSVLFSLYEYHRGQVRTVSQDELSFPDKVRPGAGGREKVIEGIPINVNIASSQELSHLPGISMDVAKEIVKERERGGPFRRLTDLLRVKGIKHKKLEMIIPFIEM